MNAPRMIRRAVPVADLALASATSIPLLRGLRDLRAMLSPFLGGSRAEGSVFTSDVWSLLLQQAVFVILVGGCVRAIAAPPKNATWSTGTSSWSTAGNWTPSIAVPTGIATFASAGSTSVSAVGPLSVDTLQFNSGAPAYSFSLTGGAFKITGSGIQDSSSNAPSFATSASGQLNFKSTNATSTAGDALITNNSGGGTQFIGASTAGTATITNNGGTGQSGSTEFQDTSTAATATIITNSTGTVFFINTSSGGQASFVTNTGGAFDISGLSSGGTTAGSIAGAGAYQLGSKALTVGANNSSTAVSGNIVDAGLSSGTGGSLIKVGTGTLTLSGANTYTGVTTVSTGTLQAGSTTGFATNSAFTVNSILDLNGFSNNVGSLAGSGNVTNNGGTTATLTAGGDNTTTVFSGTLADGSSASLGLTKNGTGTMTLSGTNTYSGGTTLNGGILAISSDSNLGTGSLKLSGGTLELLTGITSSKAIALRSGGGTLLADATTTSTFSGAISNGGALTKNGAGTLILSGNNNYSGATTASAGTLLAGSTTGFSTNSAFTVTSALDLNGFSNNVGSLAGNGSVTNNGGTSATLTAGGDNTTTVFSGTLADGASNSLGLNKNGTGTMTLSGTNTYSGGTVFNGGILAVSSDGNLGTGPLKFSGGTLEILTGITSSKATALQAQGGTILADTGTTSTFSGAISNGGALTKNGAGTLILSGNNSYSGATTVSAGTLQAGSTTGFSRSSAFTVTSTLDLASFSNTVGSLSGTGTITNSGAATSVTLTAGGDNSSTTFGGTLINGAGTVGLTKTGIGTLTLTGSNTYTGGTTISAGTLQIGSGGAAGSLNGNVLDQGTLALDRSDTLTFTGNVSGTGTLSQIGGGMMTLSGNNTYSGVTNVSAGTLQTGSITGLSPNSAFTVNSVLDLNGFSSRLGSLAGSGTLTNNGGISAILTAGVDNTTTVFSGTLTDGTTDSLQLDKNGTGTMTLSGTNTYSGGTVFNGGILAVSSDSNLGTGPLKLSGGTLELLAGITSSKAITLKSDGGGGTILTDAGTTSSFSGAISNVGGLTKSGVGILILSGNNSYSGVTTVSAGKLLAGSTTGFSSSSAFTVNSVLDLNGFSNTVASLAGSGTVTNGGSLNQAIVFPLTPIGTPVILTTGGDGTSTVFSGTLVDGTSSLGMTKTGVGTLTLTGTNTYTGGTTVMAGTLQVDGGLGNTALTVQSGATLAGQGTIAGSVTIQDGGHLAPGPGAQTLSVGSLSLSTGSILDYQLSAPGVIGSGVNTLVNVVGNLTLDGVLNVTNGGNFGSGSYRLLNYTGTLTDLTLGLGTLPMGFSSANVTVTTAVAGQVNLVVNADGAPTQFWDGSHTTFDGTVHGGSGIWDNFTTNFTNGTAAPNQAWQNGVADFSAAPGTVTLGADILFQGIQFSIDGYTVAGAGTFALHPTGTATITTDSGVTATIAALIVGTGGLNKAGSGLLILSGENTYSGGTTVSGGSLSAGSDTNLGDPSGGVTLDGGELSAGNGFSTSRTVALTANGGTLAAATGGEAIFSGNLTGAGSLRIGDAVNTGTVALGGINTYLASTVIASGAMLQALSTTALSPTSAFTVTGTLDVNGFANEIGSLAGGGTVTNGGSTGAVLATGAANSSTIFSGVLEDGTAGLGLSKAGTGILKLSGANSYSGATTVSAGTLQAGSLTAFSPNSAFTVNGVLDLHGFSSDVGSLAGSGTVTNSGGPGSAIVVTPLLPPGAPATLTVGGDGTSTLFSGALMSGTVPVIGVEPLGTGNTTLALTKTGGGTLSLTGANTYTGGTTLNGGILAVDSDSNLGTGALHFNGGALEALLAGAGITSSKTVTFLAGGGTFIGDATTTSTLNGVISGAGSLTKSGVGALALTAAETYTGGTAISAGALALGNGGASGSIVGNVTDNGTLVFNRSDNITFGGIVSGTGILSQVGPGTLTLTGMNLYTGGTTVSSATLSVGSNVNLGNGSGGLTLDGGKLLVANGFSAARTVALTANGGTLSVAAAGGGLFLGNITGAGGLTVGDAVNTGVVGLGGTDTYLGSTTIVSEATLRTFSETALSPASALIIGGTLDVNGFSNEVGSLAGGGTVTNGDTFDAVLKAGGDNSSTVFSGALEDGTDPLGLTKVGLGTLRLSGSSAYSDPTTVTAGTLEAGSVTAFSPNSAFTVNGILDLGGFSNTVSSLAGSGTVTNGGVPNNNLGPFGDPTVGPAVLTAGGDGTNTVFSGVLRNGAGSLGLKKTGGGTLTLTGTNTYTGGTTVTTGILQIGNGAASGSIVGEVMDNAALVFNRSDTVTFAGAVSGTGNLSQAGNGTLVLTGTSTYTGTTVVSSGTLQVDGVLGNTAVTVQAGTTLSGQGTIGGSVTILDAGHLAPGPAARTLGVGSLVLSSGSILDYQLSTPGVIGSGVNSLVNVAGNLTLAGVLNVTDGGSFGSGSYRLINYGGTLTDQTLTLGTLPVGFSGSTVSVTTAVAGQVNLVVNATGAPTQFWDGSNTVFDSTVHGGNGTWNNFATNFTNGTAAPNQSWQNGVAVFSEAPGSVTLRADILFQGMQFSTTGYVVTATGAFALHPTGIAIITTDTGVAAGISAPIVGTGGLSKAGLGLLTLAGENTYSGGTNVSGGVLIVSTDISLGDPSGGINLDGGELETTAIFTSAREVGIVSESVPNILAAASSTTATYTGLIFGSGGLTVGDGTHLGTVAITNVANSYDGGTTVSGATLSVVDNANLGYLRGGITLDGGELLVSEGFLSYRSLALTANGGTLAAVAGVADFQGNITGAGGLTIGDAVNTGIVGLAGTNTYLGTTTIVSGATLKAISTKALSPTSAFIVMGTLDVAGHNNEVGSLAGAGTVTNGDSIKAVLTVGNNESTVFSGVLQDGLHALGLTKVGTGTLTLSGINTYSANTTVSVGTLQAGSVTAFSSNSAFTVDSTLNLHGFSNAVGALAGTGTVTNGPGVGDGISPLGTPMVGPAVLTVGAKGTTTVFSGTLMDGVGTIGLTKVGAGKLTLTGANTYTGGTIITAGTLQVGNGGTTGGIAGDVTDNSALAFARSDSLTFAGMVSGTGNLSQAGPGTLVLTGTSTYTGSTGVSGGTLQVDGALGNTAVTVQNASTLAGQGTIAGEVTIQNGGHLAPGPGAETLGVGDLVLNSSAMLDYQLSNPGVIGSGVNSLVNVTGDLTLAGVLNVTNGGNFGSGFYRLLNYTGALTNNTLDLGTLPMGFSPANVTVTTAVAGQVNLVVNASGALTQLWDGSNTVNDLAAHGGNGTWDNFTTNFTNVAGTVNEAWQNGIAIFTANWGTVTLGSDILYQGMTFVSSDYAVVGDVSGSFALHPTGVATITTDSGVIATIAAPIVGLGGLNKAGPGLLILMGANTYSGGTTVSGGTLSVGSDSNLGDPSVGVTLNGGELLTSATLSTPRAVALIPLSGTNTLAAAVTTTATYTGVISGGNTLTVGDPDNQGTVVLSNPNNSYSGGTNVLPGTLVAGGNSALGTGIVQMFNGTLTIPVGVTLSNEVMFVSGGVLNNAGTLNNNVLDEPEKAVTVVNSGTINGNVIIGGNTDTVQLFAGSRINGNLALSGGTSSTLILDGVGQQLLSLAVVGTVTNNGTLVKQGSGTWTIDRALAAPVGTQILAGTLIVEAALTTAQVNISPGAALQLNSGGTVGSLVNNGSLNFSSSDIVTFATVITGPGSVIQNGTGTTILSGRNTYSGGTIIELGTLLVDNAQALGTGNVTVNGGVLGADPQPINVLGNYTQNAGGTLQLNIAGRAPGQFDVLNVAGSAALNGTLRLLNLGYQPQGGDKLILVTAGGVISGRFAKFQNPFTVGGAFNTVNLLYARNSVTLEFLQTNIPGEVSATDFRSFALTPNQGAAANLLDAVQLDPKAANLMAFLEKVPFAGLPNTFHEISPEGLSAFYEISFSNANIQRLNLESRMDDLRNGANGFSSNMKVNNATLNLEERVDADGKSSQAVVEPILQPGPGNRWGVWMTGFGDFVSVDGDANANGYNFTTGGVSLGIDYRLTDELVVGVMAEYSHTWTLLKPSGSNGVNSGRGGVYATWSHHGFYLNGAVYGGYNSYNSSRSALQGLASGNTEGAELSTFISGGYDFHLGLLTVGPVAALQYTYANIDGFSESGSLAPMQIQSGTANSLRSDVGFRLFYQWQVGKVIIEPSLKAAWEHEYLYSALPITAEFANIPGPTATFTGPAEGHDSAIVSAGVSVQWTPALTTYVNYDGQLGRSNYDSNAVTGGVRISF